MLIHLPDDFTECIYHTGNALEMHSIIKSELIQGGKSLRRDRQSVFFTAVNPMYARQDLEEFEYDLDEPRIAPFLQTWKAHHKTVYWCNLKLAQRKGLQNKQTNSITCNCSFKHTASDLYRKSGMHENW